MELRSILTQRKRTTADGLSMLLGPTSIMLDDLEYCSDEIYRFVGVEDRTEVLYPSVLARRSHGSGCIQRMKHARTLGAMGHANGKVYYAIASWLKGAMYEFTVGHEHAHWWFEREGFRSPQIEECCDFVAAALMVRRGAFLSVINGRERDFAGLASDFETSETMIALRIGEVLQTPVAVVAPHAVRARGRADWPDEQRIRQIARTGLPGLARVRLGDDSKRIALIGDEEAGA